MRLRLILPIAVLTAAMSPSTSPSDTFVHATRPTLDEPRAHEPSWLTAIEPSASLVEPGDQAPDFSYQSATGEWSRLHELLQHGSLVLVFLPSETDLRTLASERGSLLGAGIVPVAVLDRRSSSTNAIARRLALTFPVIADPIGTIASQFNLVGPPTGRARPGWFVLDRSGRVRALDRGQLPRGGFAGVAFQALSIPAPDAARSVSSPRR